MSFPLKPEEGILAIAALQESDTDSVLDIEAKSFEKPWNRRMVSEELNCRDAFNLAVTVQRFTEEKAKIVAYLSFRMILDEMHIMKIAVSPEWRSRGIGKWLFGKGIDAAKAKGAVTAFTEVRQSNLSAVSLYKGFGFQIIGKRLNYYPETGEDALVMMKNLKEVL